MSHSALGLGWFLDGVEGVGQAYSDTLTTLGINERQRLGMEIQLASNGVYHAIVIAFGRAIAEVGAVIMVGGNIAGKTRVMTTSIVLETSKGTWSKLLYSAPYSLFSLSLVARRQVRQRRKTTNVPLLGDSLSPDVV